MAQKARQQCDSDGLLVQLLQSTRAPRTVPVERRHHTGIGMSPGFLLERYDATHNSLSVSQEAMQTYMSLRCG